MQCKDIDTDTILRHMKRLADDAGKPYTGIAYDGLWISVHDGPWPNLHGGMPPDTPQRLMLAKMRQLINGGLVFGCCCGCRGDFTLSHKALERLRKLDESIGQSHDSAILHA